MATNRPARGVAPALLGAAVAATCLGTRSGPSSGGLTFLPLPRGAPLQGSLQPPSARPASRVAAAAEEASEKGTWRGAAAFAGALAAISWLRASRPSKAEPKVQLHARSPFPSAPTGGNQARRIELNPNGYEWFQRRRSYRDKRRIDTRRQLKVRVNPMTNKPILYWMHVKSGDIVQVMKGKDQGKVTTVLKVYRKWNKILCLGVNYCIKHVRPRRQDETGQRVQVEAPMHSSRVMHYSEEKGVAGRLGIRYEVDDDGQVQRIRYNKATDEVIPRRVAPKWVPVLDRVNDDDDDDDDE